MVLSMGTWAFKSGKGLPWGGKITRKWKIRACETVCFLVTKQGVGFHFVFPIQASLSKGEAEASRVSSPCWASKEVFSSPPSSPRWLLPDTKSTKPTNLGGLMLWLRKTNSSQTKAERDSRDGSGLDFVLPPSKNILLNTKSDNNPAVTTASSNPPEWEGMRKSRQLLQEQLGILQMSPVAIELVSFSSLPVDKNSWMVVYAPQTASLSHPYIKLNQNFKLLLKSCGVFF